MERALSTPRGALHPDVVLLDVGLPDGSGLEVARQLHESDPQLAVVVVSTHDSSDYRDLAVAGGALGFLVKAELTGTALKAPAAGAFDGSACLTRPTRRPLAHRRLRDADRKRETQDHRGLPRRRGRPQAQSGSRQASGHRRSRHRA
jgi:DNA-binding NarL/FixJ family response regulator